MNSQTLVRAVLAAACALTLTACISSGEERGTAMVGSDAYYSDSAISGRVKAELQDKNLISDPNLKVETTHGTVAISGHVASHGQMIAVLSAVQRVDGVKNVINQLDEDTAPAVSSLDIPAQPIAIDEGSTSLASARSESR